MEKIRYWGWMGFLLWMIVFLPLLPAEAHPLHLVSTDLSVEGNQIHVSMLINEPLLEQVAGKQLVLKENKVREEQENQIESYIKTRFVAKNNNRPMPFTLKEITRPEPGHYRVEGVFVSTEPVGKVDLSYQMFFEFNKSQHQNVVKIHNGDQEGHYVFHDDNRHLTFSKQTDLSVWLTAKEFVYMGMTHIWFGFDHLAFLAGLLVAAGNAKNLLKVITCFTVAHSITLILAVMDIIAAPSKWVEVLIALTIVYVAVENFFFRTYPHRLTVTFFFGLIHGLGFAGSLADIHLPKTNFLTALFSFNAGIEIGQLLVVSLVFPLLRRIRMQNGALERRAIRWVSAVMALLGVLWMVERAFEIQIPFFPI